MSSLTAVGLASDSVQRFNRLGAFLSSLQLPWVAVGDYNVPSDVLQSSGFLTRVGGVVVKAPVEYTCDAGREG
eukprot:3277288-Pyramimonas_sp.AAC.1